MIDWQLEFLRPWWFLATLPVFWLLWNAWQIKHQQGRWQSVIEPKFQRLLLGVNSQSVSQTNLRLALAGLTIIWLLAITALAGPSLKSVKLPAAKTQQGSVIILDLSLSMLADDIAPTRISRARFKLIDLLEKHPELSVGLVGYAGTAHRIMPISEDNATLLEMLPALNPVIMPQYGSDPLAAMKLAEQMLQATQITQGHLIWITDDLEPEQRIEIEKWLNQRNLSLSILAVGTQTGGTVQIPNHGLLRDDNDQIITPKLPYKEFQKLSKTTGAALTPITVDDRDISILIPSNLSSIAAGKQQDNLKEVVHKLDNGAVLVLLLLPLLAFAYRRGWLFSLSLLMLLPLGAAYSPPSYAESEQATQKQIQLPNFLEAFETQDQQGYKAWKNDNYSAAEALFESPQWRGAAHYRLENYSEAANQFKKDPSAKGRYNLGNALAKQGELEAAKQAYEQALNLQPEFAEAQSNLQLINQLLEQQNASDNASDSSSGEPQPNSSDQSQNKPNKDQQNQQESQDKNSQPDENGQSSEQQPTEPTEPEQTDQEEQPTENSQQNGDSDSAKQEQTEQDQSNESGENSENEQASSEQNEPDNSNDDQERDSAEPESQQSGSLDDAGSAQKTAEEREQMEQERATDNWLKQIPDQPGLYLQRKFEYQYQQQNSSKNPPSKPVEKIW